MRTIPPRLAAVAVVFATILQLPSAPRAQILANGNFEQGPDIPLASPIFTVGVGGTALTGWSVTGGAVAIVTDNYWVPLSGHRSLELSTAAGPGAVQQAIGTSPGATYRLTFWLSGEPFSTPTLKHLRVNAGAVQQDFTFDNTPAWHWDMAWAQHSLDFAATGTSTLVKLSGLDATAWSAAVDSAKVELVSAGVPAAHTLEFAGVSPDPVGERGSLSFTLASPGAVRLVVHDVQGREVAVLADGTFGAGPHRLEFAPRAHGVRAGMYFAELRTGAGSLVRRFVVLH